MAKKNPALDLIFQALADPTRRAVLDQLRDGPVAITELAEPFAMALPSFTKHIVTLEKAGLIRTKKKGRSRLCTLQGARMTMVDRWLADHREVAEDRTSELFAISRTLYSAEHTV